MKVLTVDDSRMIRTLVRKYLGPLNLEIVEADNGQTGLQMAAQEQPDLIILDVNMPVMDGAEMLKALRADPSTKHLKVLMLTAESAQKLVLELIKQGISDYIVKPFEEEMLVKKVCKILQYDPAKAGADASSKRVLVVDANESILVVARRWLTGVAEVIATTHPEKALQLASQHSPQLALLDLQTDGLQLVEQMRSDQKLKSIRYVCLATKSLADQSGDLAGAGFSEVLYKPFNQESLTKLVTG